LAVAVVVAAVLLLPTASVFGAGDEQEFNNVRFKDAAGFVMTVKGPNCTHPPSHAWERSRSSGAH
jgi:hypothetical protein